MSMVAGAAVLALSHAGLAGLCLAMSRHQQQVWERVLSPLSTQGVRIGGWLLLAVSFAACLRYWGGAVGPVVWFGLMSFTAASIVLMLSYTPRLLSRCAITAAPIGLVLLFADLGIAELDAATDRAMICGSPSMLSETAALLDPAGRHPVASQNGPLLMAPSGLSSELIHRRLGY